MSVFELYKELVKQISPVLKESNFKRSANNFYLRHGDNWGLINFQKSTHSNIEEIRFTVNLGVSSGKSSHFYAPDLPPRKPLIQTCHWEQRIGKLLPEANDKWWQIRPDESIDHLVHELKTCIANHAIPEITQHISDEQLVGAWLSGKSLGTSDFQRLKHLSVLRKLSGANIDNIIEELKRMSSGRPSASFVELHIEDLEKI